MKPTERFRAAVALLFAVLLPAIAAAQTTVFASKSREFAAFVSQADSERLDWAVIGDSNAFWGAKSNGGYGLYKGLASAMAQRYGLYKSPTLPGSIANSSWNSNSWTDASIETGLIPGGKFVRYTDFSNSSTNGTNSNGTASFQAPAELHQYAIAPLAGATTNTGGGTPWGYHYFADAGAMVAPNQTAGPHWWQPGDATRPGLLDIDANLTYHLRYGTFETGSGQFALQCKDWASSMPNGSGVSHANGSTINPVTGSYGLADTTLVIPAGSRGANGITIRPLQTGSTSGGGTRVDLAGPYFGLWQCLVNDDQTTGVGVSIAGHFGGQTARHAADYYLGSDGSLAAGYSVRTAFQEFWRFTLSKQRGTIADAKLVVSIHFAQNDIDGDSPEPSLGPSPAASDTKQGFADNHRAIINQLRADLTAAGLDVRNVWFSLGPYANNPAQSASTRNEWAQELEDTFADDDRVVVMFGQPLYSDGQIRANGGYDPLAAHLEPASYDAFAEAAVTAIAGAAGESETPTAAEISAAVRSDLAPELARIDVATSTRSSHAAPDLSPLAQQATLDTITAAVSATQSRVETALPATAPGSGAGLATADNTASMSVSDEALQLALVPDGDDVRLALTATVDGVVQPVSAYSVTFDRNDGSLPLSFNGALSPAANKVETTLTGFAANLQDGTTVAMQATTPGGVIDGVTVYRLSGGLTGEQATQLSQAASGAGGQPRVNLRFGKAFTLRLSRRSDGTLEAPKRVRVGPGSRLPAVRLMTTPVYGDVYVTLVGETVEPVADALTVTPSGQLTATAIGPKDDSACVLLGGTAAEGVSYRVDVPITMANGDPDVASFFVDCVGRAAP